MLKKPKLKGEYENVYESSMVDDFYTERNKLKKAVDDCSVAALEYAVEAATIAHAAYNERDISTDKLIRMRKEVEELTNKFKNCSCAKK